MLYLINKYPAFVFLISLLLFISLITLSYITIFLVGSAYPLLLANGSPHTCLTQLSLPFHLIFLPHLISLVTFRKALSLVLFFSIFTLYLFSYQISSSTISHLLYADDTQLFISFILKHFLLAVSDLQSTVSLISSWMSSNYLTQNPSNTEFLLIGLPQQTSKIMNPFSFFAQCTNYLTNSLYKTS